MNVLRKERTHKYSPIPTSTWRVNNLDPDPALLTKELASCLCLQVSVLYKPSKKRGLANSISTAPTRNPLSSFPHLSSPMEITHSHKPKDAHTPPQRRGTCRSRGRGYLGGRYGVYLLHPARLILLAQGTQLFSCQFLFQEDRLTFRTWDRKLAILSPLLSSTADEEVADRIYSGRTLIDLFLFFISISCFSSFHFIFFLLLFFFFPLHVSFLLFSSFLFFSVLFYQQPNYSGRR